MRFVDKVCVVTGGSSGIGRATCQRLAAEGGKIGVIGLNPERGKEVVRGITEAGREAVFLRADVANSFDTQDAISKAAQKWGRIDLLVNAAAMMTFVPLIDLSETDWDRVMAVNLRAVYLFCKYSVPHMPAGGAIVNVSSIHAHATSKNVASYAASKGGMEALTRQLSVELGERRIRANCVAPGAINTRMLRENPNVKSGAEKIEGPVGEAEDVAAAICFLAAEEARFINGVTLLVDGGRMARL